MLQLQTRPVLHTRVIVVQALLSEERKIRQEMDQVYRLYIDNQITPAGFGERYKPLEERCKQVEDQIPELQAEVDFLKIQYLSSDQVLQEARDLYSRWPELCKDDRRTIVENVVERITIGKDDISIHLAYVPASSELMVERQHNLKGSSPPRA
jgi:site-specific DNA recombinase